MNEEIFGPLIPITPFLDIDEAIDIIKKKGKPLVVYYFGKANSANMRHLIDKT
jgi:acyl-CoA reductase-like NAD-dependent aldehyde dehydrogenase